VKQQQQSAPCQAPGISSHNKKREEPREPPFLFPFSFFLPPTRRGWVKRDYESRREQSGQRDKSYLASRLNVYRHALEQWPGLHRNFKLSQGYMLDDVILHQYHADTSELPRTRASP